MRYRFEFRPYRRQFSQPLVTHHGLWRVRDGIILRLTDETGRQSFGEIAPIAWFGSESFEQAIDFCRQRSCEISTETIFSIPRSLSACQFGFESAWELLTNPRKPVAPLSSLSYSQLLPTGRAAIQTLQKTAIASQSKSQRTFKWKIGVSPLSQELDLFEQLVVVLPNNSSLRLDANGGLDESTARQWLEVCDAFGVEFLEQPLPVEQFEVMQKLSSQYLTPIALDESVATLAQIEGCYRQGWRGIFVIKPAIAGSPDRLRQFCQNPGVDMVWSSVFETAIARHFVEMQLIASTPDSHRALGFGVRQWFDDALNQSDFEALWHSL